MSSAEFDPEMGIRPSGYPLEPPKSASFIAITKKRFGKYEDEEEDDDDSRKRAQPEPLITGDNKLVIFRRLTGIESGITLTKKKSNPINRYDANRGIYQHVIEEEENTRKKYVFFSRLINFCLGLQIIVAAALTALGAGDGPHAVVTVFGAINTVIAGFLTYLKGSGLPNRTKFFQNEWGRLRDHIEQQERNFGCEGYRVDVYDAVRDIEEKYKAIRDEIEANTPDAYTSVGRATVQARNATTFPLEKPTNLDSTGTSSHAPSTGPRGSENHGMTGSGMDKKQEG